MPSTRKIEAGSRLRECRLRLKLTQGEVAQRLAEMGRKVSDAAISSYESGSRTIDAFTLLDLCLIYGASTDYVLLGTDTVPRDLRDLFARVGRRGGQPTEPGT